jgi:hypothetical protein
MGDPITARIANLEAVVFPGMSAASAQVVSTPGVSAINVLNGALILLTASGSVKLSLAAPTAQQNNFVLWLVNANGFTNTVTGGPFSSTGTPAESYSSLTDSGAFGNLAKLIAINGAWQFSNPGIGWSGVGSGLS